jgi:hypothetical protein
MPLLILLLLIILIAQFGFWDTMEAVLGALAMIVLLWALVVAIVVALIGYIFRRLR